MINERKIRKGQKERNFKAIKAKEKEDFQNSLPMDKEIFQELFNYLDEHLNDGCDHSLTMTIEFLKEQGIENIDKVVEWLNNNGGYCDYEVLMNVEEKFE